MRIYLDNCALQRPLDTKSQLRIAVEAEAVLGLLELCRRGGAEMVSSDILRFEIDKCPHEVRREFAHDALDAAAVDVALTDALRVRARVLAVLGFRPIDALHLAAAEASGADYFCTCDDGILKRAEARGAIKPRIISPLDLIWELHL